MLWGYLRSSYCSKGEGTTNAEAAEYLLRIIPGRVEKLRGSWGSYYPKDESLPCTVARGSDFAKVFSHSHCLGTE